MREKRPFPDSVANGSNRPFADDPGSLGQQRECAGELTFTHLISAPRHQLQPRYLLDIVGQLAGDTALIKLADPRLADPDPGPQRGERALCLDAAQGSSKECARRAYVRFE